MVVTVNLEMNFSQKLQVASSTAKSQEVTITKKKEREVKKALNFKLRFKGNLVSERSERTSKSGHMVKYMYSNCRKALHRTLKLMHGITTIGILLMVVTVNLEMNSLDHCCRSVLLLGVNSDII